MSEREGTGVRERTTIGDLLLSLGFTVSIGAYNIFDEVAEFSHLWFPRGKYLCLLSVVIDCCACYSLR